MTERYWNKTNGYPFALAVMFVPGHLFGWLIEWLWLGAQLAIAIFYFTLHRKTPFQKTSDIKPRTWLVSCFVFIILSTSAALYSAVFLGADIIISDIIDILRFAIWLPLVLFVGAIYDESDISGVTNILKLVIVFNLSCSIIILLNIPIVYEIVMGLYAEAKVQVDYGHIRIGIPFVNPNFAALVFIFIFSYFAFFERSISYATLAIVCIFLTGSRSGVIAAMPLFTLAYMVSFKNMFTTKNKGYSLIFLSLHFVALIYISSIIELTSSLPRYFELIDALSSGGVGGVETASIRFDVVNSALEFVKLSPYIGWGPGRSYGLDIIDSQLVSWVVLLGFPGAILIACLFLALFINIALCSQNWEHRLAAIATCVSFFLLLATGDFMKNYRLFFIVVLLTHMMSIIVSRKLKRDEI